MSRTRKTPPLSVRGRFTVNSPYVLVPGNVYEVIELRYFVGIENDGEDVYKSFYEPKGLDISEYRADASIGAVIVTLRDPHGNTVDVPDTFIASYPTMSDFEYQHVVLSVSLGALPTYVDLTFAMDEIKGVINATLGIEMGDIVVKLGSAPKQGTITPEQHELLEAARLSAITNTKSVYARNVELEASLATAQTTINALTQIINPP